MAFLSPSRNKKPLTLGALSKSGARAQEILHGNTGSPEQIAGVPLEVETDIRPWRLFPLERAPC